MSNNSTRLRNTVLEGLVEEKINEENYDIIDRRLDKYLSEISEEKEKTSPKPNNEKPFSRKD